MWCDWCGIFVIILLGVHWTFWIIGDVFQQTWEFLDHYCFTYFFSAPFSLLSFSDSSYTYVTLFDNNLRSSDWIICTDLFPGSLVLSSVVFSLLLSPSSEVCISHLYLWVLECIYNSCSKALACCFQLWSHLMVCFCWTLLWLWGTRSCLFEYLVTYYYLDIVDDIIGSLDCVVFL